MTELSSPWADNAVGDGQSYSDDEWSDIWRKLFMTDRTDEGVLADYSSELAVTNPSGVTIRTAAGAALVDGKFYENDANVDNTVTAPGSGSNYYRIVLRKDWTAQTVRIEMLGPNVTAPDAVTQTDGTTWEISLATVQITSGSVVTVTDTRVFVNTSLINPDDSTLEISATGVLQVKASGITTDEIANGSVTRLITPFGGVNTTDSIALLPGLSWPRKGLDMIDNKVCEIVGAWKLPEDYVSGLTIQGIVYPNATGNAYMKLDVCAGADGEDLFTHTGTDAISAIAVTASQLNVIMSVDMSASVSAGDYLAFNMQRDGTDVLDTVGNSVYGFGFLLTYTSNVKG